MDAWAKGINNPLSCTGCGACEWVCPVDAITLKLNEYGFFSATADGEKCVGCSKCQNVCALDIPTSAKAVNVNERRTYRAKAKDREIYDRAASGGVGGTIYSYARKKGYHFVGAVYDNETNRVVMQLAEPTSAADKFQGSKYLQPLMSGLIEKCLNTPGKKIVCALPCHTRGFINAVEAAGKRDEFIFIDLLCHGPLSYKVWDAFLDESRIGRVERVSFRSHSDTPGRYILNVHGEDKKYSKDRRRSSFYKAFDDAYMISDACASCNINQATCVSDIRIGDSYKDGDEPYWSRVSIASDRGAAFWSEISDLFEIEPLDERLPARTPRRHDIDRIRRVGFGALNKGKSCSAAVRACRRSEKIKVKAVRFILNHKLIKRFYASLHRGEK